ncbi:MAG: FAD-binding oxidoreductase [Pseudomonadota bacterium]
MRIAVLGAGLIGSAAARHLALAGHDVTLIGPGEPKDWAGHRGVFASHYDEGRITRGIDFTPFWAEVSRASIGRYGDIAAASGIDFFTEVGGVMAALDLSRVAEDGAAAGLDLHRLAPVEARALGYHLPNTVSVLHEASRAGHISPRRLVAAQQAAGAALGVSRVEEVVHEVNLGRVTTDQSEHEFDQVLWAAGGFGAPHLDLPLNVQGRTVVYFEISEAEALRRAQMPTLILENGRVIDIYLLPPIRYPDGRWYFKIGGGPHDRPLRTEMEMRRWFKSGGDPEAARSLSAIFRTLVPDAAVVSESIAPCVTTYTPDDLPVIGRLDDRTCVATAGCGRGAKCSDELGRLGALAVTGDVDARLDPGRFSRAA